MLLLIRAGHSSRLCASFIRLAKHRAHRRHDIGGIASQWRCYATEPVGPVGPEGEASGSLLSAYYVPGNDLLVLTASRGLES